MTDKTFTIAEAGWKRIDSSTLRWVGEPQQLHPNLIDKPRDFLEVAARYRNDEPLLVLHAATLGEDDDPDAEDFDPCDVIPSCLTELPRPAVIVLHAMLTSWLDKTNSRAT